MTHEIIIGGSIQVRSMYILEHTDFTYIYFQLFAGRQFNNSGARLRKYTEHSAFCFVLSTSQTFCSIARC